MAGYRICLECGNRMVWNKVLHAWWCTECQNILDEEKGFGSGYRPNDCRGEKGVK